MRDYRGEVSRQAPEGLIARALEHDGLSEGVLLYEVDWTLDTSVASVLEGRGRGRAVRCTCSECGHSGLYPYVPPERLGGYGGKSPYGFLWDGVRRRDLVREGDQVECPYCGAVLTAVRAARVGQEGQHEAGDAYLMSVQLLGGPDGERPVALVGWQVRKLISREGGVRYEARPMEAYIFDGAECCSLRGWRSAYSGSAGYFTQFMREWSQPQKWADSWREETYIFGLTEELWEQTSLANARLPKYMAGPGGKWPIEYLRLWQRCRAVETVVEEGLGRILSGVIAREIDSRALDKVPEGRIEAAALDLTARRPGQLLRLDREELRWARRQSWDHYHWQIYVLAKQVGDRLRLPEDIVLLHQYGAEDVAEIIGQAPVGKALEYLLDQIGEWSAAHDVYNEYGEEMEPREDDDLIGATLLRDYWDMANRAGWDLGDKHVRWPRDLLEAHDRAAEAAKTETAERIDRRIRERCRELARLSYASGGIFIRPAGSQGALNAEGKALSHCVGTYAEDVAKGESAIFFVRRVWAPGESWYTLEYDERLRTVRQNRGRANCNRTPEVQAFEEEWLSWVRRGCPRDRQGRPTGARPVIREDPKQKKEGAA